MIGVSIAIRSAQLGASLLLAGGFIFLLVVARPAFQVAKGEGPSAFERFDARVLHIAWWSLLALFTTGLLGLWLQLATVTGLPWLQALTPDSLWSLLSGTQYGRVWSIRLSLVTLLGGILWLHGQEQDGKDWWALRLEAAGLAVSILLAQVWMGHAAAGEGIGLVYQVLADGIHLLATGVWLGSLPLLALLLLWMQRGDFPGAEYVAAESTRRFSALALASMGLLILSGLANAWELVGTIPALIGTTYGRLLMLKVSLLLPLLGLAALNLLRDKPRLLQGMTAPAHGNTRLVLYHLRRNVLGELVLGGGILLVVGALSIMPPAVHEQPNWPFASRLSWEATKELPGVRTSVAIGIQVSLFGFFVALIAPITRIRRWPWIFAAGAITVGAGFWLWLPKLTIDAYPTTYVRPIVPYNALSIAHGLQLYDDHCAVCHGTEGYGDGPAAAVLRPRPADLTAKHTADHTAGDIFWWLTHGMKERAMPGFQDRLNEEERWDLINVVRILSASEQARALGPRVSADLRAVAPDFTYTTPFGEARTLKEFRGRDQVLLVFFSLPQSRQRLVQLQELYAQLRPLGVEILGIPWQQDNALDESTRHLSLAFPLVRDGGSEAATTYALFRRSLSPEFSIPDPPLPAHLEFLVDRQGYLRGRWSPDEGVGWSEPAQLMAAIEELRQEKLEAPAPDLHVH
jgi:putative copper export protein/mono/diheme cytochrome c family protein/peroxiredoxin